MAIKTIDIPLPKSVHDLRIRHLKALTDTSFKDEDITINNIIIFLANISLVSVAQLRRCEKGDLIKHFNYCMALFNEFTLSGKPPKEITINDIEYDFIDPNKAPVGWHIDIEASDFQKDPTRLACICYIPKGTSYGDLDNNDNVLHPIASRYEDFKEHFSLINFLELNTFFFLKLERSIKKYTEKEKIKKKLLKIKTLFAGTN